MRKPISVCIASYNGERYIERQLLSILSQLTPSDELIIVDDCSSDSTLSIIKAIMAPNSNLIKMYENSENLGYVKNFEKAIRLAKNEIVFLSDQDDEWLDGKVENVLTIFDENKEIDLVYHDAVLVDGEGKEISKSWWDYADLHPNRGFWWNYYKNSYSGCMMAVKRKELLSTLPFPSDVEYHDQWIALSLKKQNKKFHIMKNAQMNYTRHGENMSGVIRNPTYLIIWKKMQLFFRISLFRAPKTQDE